MMESLWEKLEDVGREFDSIFRSDGSTLVSSKKFTLVEHDGHLEFTGTFKSLKINGRLVRFKAKTP